MGYSKSLMYSIAELEFSLASFLNKKDVRYNPKMSPVIPKQKWRKGSQVISCFMTVLILPDGLLNCPLLT